MNSNIKRLKNRIELLTDFPLANGTLHDYVLAMALLTHTPDGKSALASHDLEFECVSWDKCNDEIKFNFPNAIHCIMVMKD